MVAPLASVAVGLVCAFAVWDVRRRELEIVRFARSDPTRWLADAGGETAPRTEHATDLEAMRGLVEEALAATHAGERRARCRELSLTIDARLSRSGSVLRAHWRLSLLAGAAGVLVVGMGHPGLACLTAAIAALSAGFCALSAARARDARGQARLHWQRLLRALERSQARSESFQPQ